MENERKIYVWKTSAKNTRWKSAGTPNYYTTVIIGQLFPYKVKPAWINHFSVYRLLCCHVHATLSSGCSLGEPFWFGISLCNNSSFHGKTLITNSTWVTLCKGGEENKGRLLKKWYVNFLISQDSQRKLFIWPTGRLSQYQRKRKKCSKKSRLQVPTFSLLS